jgi:uncharacterized protein (DUF885 family)
MRIFLIAVLALVAGFIFYQMSNMNEEANRATAAATQMKTSTAYQDLVDLFREFREFQRGGLGDGQSYSKSGWILPKTDAVPDFSAAAMAEKYRDFGTYRAKLKAIDFKGWSTAQQVDYHLVRAEMNGYEFQHRVLSPWSLDPGFYGDVISKFPQDLVLPLEAHAVAGLQSRIRSVSEILQMAKKNLDDLANIAGDLGTLALLTLEDSKTLYESLARDLAEHHPELVADIESALTAIDDYADWIDTNRHKMSAQAGVGKENYNWLLKNVYLFPYTWDDLRTIVELEDNRVVDFQRLEENHNRHVAAIRPVQSQAEYKAGIEEAVDHIMGFLRNEEIFTVQDFLVPDGYFNSRLIGKGYDLDEPWPDKHDYFFNFSHREAVMENTHELVGHYFDQLRAERDDRPIRGGRRPYKISTARDEGHAFALEELLMHAGYLDGRNPHAREITYEQAAFRTVRALSDIYMHSGEWDLAEATAFCIDNAPHGELLEGSHHLWFELDTTLRGVGHHMLMVIGKVQFMKLMRDRANQLGDDFNLKEFMDDVYASGQIPWSLIRWEMTGYDDEVRLLW